MYLNKILIQTVLCVIFLLFSTLIWGKGNYSTPQKYDTLRILLLGKQNSLFQVGNEDYKTFRLENLELKKLLKKYIIEEKYILSVGIDRFSDPILVRSFMEEIGSLKIKYSEIPFKPFELQLANLTTINPIKVDSSSSKNSENKLCILVFSKKKLVWYLKEEYPQINVQEYSTTNLRNLLQTYSMYEIGLKFADNAGVEITKSILKELNDSNFTQYEFEELLEEEKNIALQLLNKN